MDGSQRVDEIDLRNASRSERKRLRDEETSRGSRDGTASGSMHSSEPEDDRSSVRDSAESRLGQLDEEPTWSDLERECDERASVASRVVAEAEEESTEEVMEVEDLGVEGITQTQGVLDDVSDLEQTVVEDADVYVHQSDAAQGDPEESEDEKSSEDELQPHEKTLPGLGPDESQEEDDGDEEPAASDVEPMEVGELGEHIEHGAAEKRAVEVKASETEDTLLQMDGVETSGDAQAPLTAN